MAICVTKNTTQLGSMFVLTPERYNPKRRMNLERENDGITLAEIITLENDMITAKREPSGWYQINTSDAMAGYLRIPKEPERLNSNKKILKQGDVIISRLRPYLRQVAYVDQDIQLCASTEFYVLRAKRQESIAFLVPFLLSEAAQTVFANSVEGSQHPRFKEEDILNLVLPLGLWEEREEISRQILGAIEQYRRYEGSLASAVDHINNVMRV